MILFGARLAVVPEITETDKDGLFIPQDEQDKSQIGTVELVGKDLVNDIKVGDRVFYDKNMVMLFTVDGEKHHVVDEEDVFGVI